MLQKLQASIVSFQPLFIIKNVLSNKVYADADHVFTIAASQYIESSRRSVNSLFMEFLIYRVKEIIARYLIFELEI